MGTYYRNVEKHLDKLEKGVWIEIGTERGEGSTRFFADLAKQYATKFYAVDADDAQIASSGQLLKVNGQIPEHVTLVHAKGEDFLEELSGKIGDEKVSLVYLDNFDWDYWLGGVEEPFVAGVKQNYINKMNIEMTNLNSQITHLAQAMWLVHMLADKSIVICDDTWFHPNEGIFIGKCSAVIPYLLLNGYSILHNQGYRQNSGVILGRNIN
jgi:hypothetical protein